MNDTDITTRKTLGDLSPANRNSSERDTSPVTFDEKDRNLEKMRLELWEYLAKFPIPELQAPPVTLFTQP